MPKKRQHSVRNSSDNFAWVDVPSAYNLEELPVFISQHHQSTPQRPFDTNVNPQLLQGEQLQVYTLVHHHLQNVSNTPLHLIVSGTAGTGKSYLIHCLRLLLKDCVYVTVPTGVAAFNIDGHTIHSLLRLPTKGEFKDLQGEQLQRLQQSFTHIKYLIIDEMSMVGRTTFGQVDKRLCQAYPHSSDQPLGGCSCLLFGDFGQLPPVMDCINREKNGCSQSSMRKIVSDLLCLVCVSGLFTFPDCSSRFKSLFKSLSSHFPSTSLLSSVQIFSPPTLLDKG